MSNGGCDLACKTKIIINGGNAASILTTTNDALKTFFQDGGQLKEGHRLIALLNTIEDKAVEFQNLVLEQVGFTGETGKLNQ